MVKPAPLVWVLWGLSIASYNLVLAQSHNPLLTDSDSASIEFSQVSDINL
jgi:hypothetical protein